MKRSSILLSAIVVSLLPVVVKATPIVTVYQDHLALSAYTEVEGIDGVVTTHTSSYQGPLLPSLREATVDNPVQESLVNDVEISHYAFTKAQAVNGEISLKSYAQFYWTGLSVPPGTPVWNGDLDTTIQSAVARLDWVFSVSEDLDASYLLTGVYDDSVIRIFDLTAGDWLLDIEAVSPFYPVTGQASLLAGHRYRLRMRTTDYSHGDDTESEAALGFGRGVSFRSVPEPSTLLLLLTALAVLVVARKMKTR